MSKLEKVLHELSQLYEMNKAIQKFNLKALSSAPPSAKNSLSLGDYTKLSSK